ncbi:type VI secretion system ImpA domain-containing protein [Pseudomonas chlororaphis]|jgi:type VI secretion system protein VasJ|uniref:Type VI secretion system protein TssA n=1 Tax=Pseudomonas morbosilactucae TaxID=2938197 RepID=A0A9X1YRK2_9PSED|nr:type VI secretion system protein TssA [Pseudomonas morbosilactucae]MCK9796816.1 type VI secretion system protein TssA [Pseudomonas morbosilactucae]MCK9816317.1 type VI secretion system protein TssA [Pseudomonas morbosilactucae]ROL64203.1 type VI secretion system ImpA domain-containing protein [Pseudomonas chlororaphis]WEK10783.1 MAG: type VI secretion system protein TssA [Pseudomonas sp.]
MSYSSKLSAHYLEIAQTAISKERFAGEDVRFSSEYEALESELNKAQSMHESGQIDWLKILENSEALLRTQSKDLRVAAWLTWALFQRESFPGLLAGVGLLQHLCAEHWSEVHPGKPRTRAAAISWLVPRLEQVLGENVAIKEQLPLFRRLVECLQGLDAALTEHLGDDAPLLLPISRRLSSMVQRAADNQPEPGVVGAAVAQVKQAATQLFTPGAPIDNEKEAHKALRALQESARPLCAWWLRQKASDVRALRVNRTMLWLPIDAVPERNAEQITVLRGLPADKLKQYQERFNNGQFADLLVELEASLAKAPFWFDGQRMVWECLMELNAEQAMREVEFHFALLLQRLPGVVELRFHDGAPFADPATRAWISANVMPHLQSASAPRKVEVASANQPAWELALEEVLPVLRKDGLKAAVQILKQGLQAAHGGRVRFFWLFSLARLCFLAKKYELAKTQLETLDQELQNSGLHAWEPDLALDVLHLLHSCCELLPQNHAVRERKEEIYRRLCHLDLEVVLD